MKLAVVLLAVCAIVYADIWSSCAGTSDHLKITTVAITPDPPVAGQNINISISGNLDEVVTGGTIEISIDYDGTLLYKDNATLCDTLKGLGDVCPLQKGPLTVATSQNIPSWLPTGAYTGQIILLDSGKQQITCIKLALNL
eukprot:TRINITY_DN11479_c0_g1_i2.p2 TRINITY_DN11479_c0_g1~~TRINITY_DN11479_c0_g1_i2.p2  ORF type:complete len:141 (-),score=15.12 TRINITY_DN11479_c0_g1_i2:89-511(-)